MDEKPRVQSITIRFPDDVLEALRQVAQRHERSFNGEVIWALREWLRQEEQRENE